MDFLQRSPSESEPAVACRESKGSESDKICKEHNCPLTRWCQSCDEAICAEGQIATHNSGTHGVISIADEVVQTQQGCREISQRMCSTVDRMDKFIRDLEESTSKLSIQEAIIASGLQEAQDHLKTTREISCSNLAELIKLTEINELKTFEKKILHEEASIDLLKFKDTIVTALDHIQTLEKRMRGSIERPTWKRASSTSFPESLVFSANGSPSSTPDSEVLSPFKRFSFIYDQPSSPKLFARQKSTGGNCKVFLKISWPGGNGVLEIKIKQDTLRGKQFIELCTGDRTNSFAGSTFVRAEAVGRSGENIVGGFHNESKKAIMKGVSCEDNNLCKEWTEGLVAGEDCDAESSFFCIIVRAHSFGRKKGVFGKVVSGINTLKEALTKVSAYNISIDACGIIN